MNKVGLHGENVACEYLRKQKYRIISRNFRVRNGEIDIIAIDATVSPEELVFVEVKTRSGTLYGTPLEAITPSKLKFLMRTALFYKTTHNNLPEQLRIDAISVILERGKKEPEIIHLRNISQ